MHARRVLVTVALVAGAVVAACDSAQGIHVAASACPEVGASRCNGNTPQTCDRSGQWQDVPTGACVAQTCNPTTGTCQGTCAPGEQRCSPSNTGTQTCDGSGQWQDAVACPFVCVASTSTCAGVCKPGDVRCSASTNTPQTCDTSGQWQDQPGGACAHQTCNPTTGMCQGTCAPGDQRCSPSNSGTQTCDGSGQWQDAGACPFVCVASTCGGACKPGDVGCSASTNTPQTCDMNGQWQDQATGACVAQTCNPITGMCAGVCAPGKRCLGSTPQVCDASGSWSSQPLCPSGQHCSGGACEVSCPPGDFQCSGNQPQRCDSTGTWQPNGSVCDQCIGCDPGTAACASSPRPDGTGCTDTSKCTLTAACQSGQCVAATQVECLAHAGDCNSDTCDPSTGTCTAPDPTYCQKDDVCAISPYLCVGGVCTSTNTDDHELAEWIPSDLGTGYAFSGTSPIVYDWVTLLTWQRNPSSTAYTWSDAQAYCACLGGANNNVSCDSDKMPGYPTGWRLPTLIELVSIVNFSTAFPSIDGNAFPGTPQSFFWSSSSTTASVTAWGVFFDDGRVAYQAKSTSTNVVRCVR